MIVATDSLDRVHIWLQGNESLALWLSAIATVALVGGVFFARWAVRDATRTRHAQLIVSLHEQWISDAVSGSLRLYGTYTDKKLLELVGLMFNPRDPRTPTREQVADYESLAATANLIETIGVLCKRQMLTHDVVYDVWGGYIITTWRAWEDVLPRMQAYLQEPDVFTNFAVLGRAMDARLPRASDRAPAASGLPGGAAGDSGTSGSSDSPPSASESSDLSLLQRAADLCLATLVLLIFWRSSRRQPPNA